MSDSHKSDSSRPRLKLHIFSLGLLWTAVFYAGFVWNILHEGENTVLVVYILLWLTGLTGIILVGKRFQEHSQAEENLMRQHTELKSLNSKLEVLYEVSSAIGRTLNLSELFDIILKTITGLEQFDVVRKGGIFIIKGDRMELVSHLGHPESFLDLHKDMKVGDCLCGLAAKTGEIIISGNSGSDDRHTVAYPGMIAHGHIIVPLKAWEKVIGVLYLYLPANINMDNHKINLIRSIGSQIGGAIENARLYEETKSLSLHDTLTGLANRRFLDIVFERSFARAKRVNRPLSLIMLDIDNFKAYNDTYGHSEGDRILTGIANALLEETREIDLAVRYGGEEFLVLLPETDLTSACEVAERIRRTSEAKTGITVSLGVSSYHDEMQKEDLVVKADDALYQAKQKGKNRVEVSA
jgi:diguanylate cyclase (GGDEF)-like protein